MNCADENLQLRRKLEILNKDLVFREQIIEGLEDTISNFELKCSICFDYFSNPCTISCGHTFCYICLYMWECPTCCVKITQELVLSFVIKDIIDYFIKIKSSDEERRLKKRFQEFKAISNPWGNLFHNSNTKAYEVEDNICVNCGQSLDIEIEYDKIDNIEDDTEFEDIDNDSEEDNYETSDSFINDRAIGKYS
ncbi:29593_t:CDS:2, partial [Gigaspora margarita]